MLKVAEGIYTDAAQEDLVGVVFPPAGYDSWESYYDSFWPYWNEIEGKWEK